MKKKLILFIIAVLLVCAQSSALGKKPKKESVTGKIAYFGNEPFVTMVIKAENGNVYSVSADEKLMSEIKKEFGKRIKFTGLLTVYDKDSGFSYMYDGNLEVEKFEVLKKKGGRNEKK